jgi:REP element-mobilizing transposase RayT
VGRELRSIDPAAIYHVISTGSDKGPIAWDGGDYDSVVRELAKAATRYQWEVFAWCVMTTHHHVVVRAPKNGLSAGFQLINGSHSRRMSRRYTRVAHLFRNRPTMIEMKSQAHLVAGIRYVVRNPIEAGMCARASQWPFCSFRATVGLAKPPPWLQVDMILDLFGGAEEFARLVHDGHLRVSDTDESR